MKTKPAHLLNRALTSVAVIMLAGTFIVSAQELTGPPANPKLKFSTAVPPGINAPAEVETRLGTLRTFDGFPDKASAEKLYDNLDFQRAVQAYLFAIPAVSQLANREAFSTLGDPNTVVPIFEQLLDSRGIILTGISKGLTLIEGKMHAKLTNDNGVTMYLAGETEGLASSLGAQAFEVTLK